MSNLAPLDYPAEKLEPFGRQRLMLECNNEIEAALRIPACSKEPWTVALIESLSEGECFWDIGANVGSYTLLAAARRLVVVAFEPVSENYGTLCRNLALNGLLDQVIALPEALGPTQGMVWMHRSDMRSGAASHLVSDDNRKQTFHKQLVKVTSADFLLQTWKLPPPVAIKLDVDGTEPDVLAGMEGLLGYEGLRTLLVELHQEWDGKLTAWLAERSWVVEEQYEQRGPIYYAKFGRKVGAEITAPTDEQRVLAMNAAGHNPFGGMPAT